MTIQRYKCLDPRGSRSDIQYKSLTERKELIGNKVFLLDICRPEFRYRQQNCKAAYERLSS